ncbi:MAG: HAD family hydrolase [Clostridia bacterium]|nr:HAD family hydrolase [Clostridia bacterium]
MNFLFDLYGTLADIKTDEELQSLWFGFAWLLGESDVKKVKDEYHEICKEYADARAHKFVEFDLLNVFEKMLENRGASKAKAKELAREFRLLSRQKLRLFPYVVEILKGLKERGAGVYLVSNAQSCFTLDELDELGIKPLFDGILISSDAGVKKPCAEIFEIAFEKFSLKREECFYVGNDLHDDVLGASEAGLKTVYIETEQSGKYPDLCVSADYIVATHEEMKELLFKLSEAK